MVGVKEGDGFGDLDDGVGDAAGEAAKEDAVDGRSLVLQGAEDEFDVRVLPDLVAQFAAHDSASPNDLRSRVRDNEERETVQLLISLNYFWENFS